VKKASNVVENAVARTTTVKSAAVDVGGWSVNDHESALSR
jgi:hypothetical protein